MINKLYKNERNEPMMVTWGRIMTIVRGHSKDDTSSKRFELLINKIDRDISNAKIEENYFNDK